MSTLPFLLSVADELDNINSQSYMDDFGLGFHPHRQYYRTPTIQLSLPAGTEWMEERQRCRTHKFYDETQNNLQPAVEEDDAYNNYDDDNEKGSGERGGAAGGATTSAGSRSKYKTGLNLNGGEDDNVDNSVRMYNLSKKCCKNYYEHDEADKPKSTTEPAAGRAKNTAASSSSSSGGGGSGGYRLHAKCMEGNHSSSEESLQKVSSSIEFLTCFLVKKTRPSSKHSSSAGGSTSGSSSKKS